MCVGFGRSIDGRSTCLTTTASAFPNTPDPANDDPLVGGGGSGSSAPLIDLVLARADPKALAEPYIQGA